MSDYIRFDRRSEALSSLKEFASCLARVNEDAMVWKWAIISIDNALQGYMTTALIKGNSFDTWRKKDLKAWLAAHDADEPYPVTRLDGFYGLYEKAFGEEIDKERGGVWNLHEIRNSFVHFNIDGHSISSDTCLDICTSGYEAIKQLITNDGGRMFYEDCEREAYEEVCAEIDKLLPQIAELPGNKNP